MRDLEQCRAEVFRRSEEKIKERARMRRRALTLCVPLALCLMIGAVTAPALLRDGKKAAVAPTTVDNSAIPSVTGQNETVNANDDALRLESDAAEKLLRSLAPADTAVKDGETNEQPDGPDTIIQYEQEGKDGDGDAYGNRPYRFTLVTPEGEETYTLYDGVLKCETGDWQRALTPEEERDLLLTLGLPVEESR
ncbi:MAG: hypothetical protein II458_07735 [Oscillospiraceae bacterium]|nr:hypothetical protein [Oscillospiraceae bacterium]